MKRAFFFLICFSLLVLNGYAQTVVVRSTEVVNSCVTKFTMGTSTEDLYVVVVFKCSSTWVSDVSIGEFSEALVVAGGGGGGKRNDSGGVRGAGGGGAGGVTYITDPSRLVVNGIANITVTVGAGGMGASNPNLRGGTGEDSRIDTGHFAAIISKGGGGGGSANAGSISGDDQRAGGSGGSGGGGVSRDIPGGVSIAIGSGNTGIGNAGGEGNGTPTSNPTGGGGGGGASQAGQQPAATQAGRGGNGATYVNLTQGLSGLVPQGFAAGGGGVGGNSGNLFPQTSQPNGGTAGGSMIGGSGLNNTSGGNGVVNTGSGGGAGGSLSSNTFSGGNGGSGIVILRYDFARILPVDFAGIEAKFDGQANAVNLTWSTAKEWNNSHFEIERSIGGVSVFKTIGEVAGKGWSDELSNYTYVDNTLPNGKAIAYYRIRQVDFDGKSSISKVISVQTQVVNEAKSAWQAYPNPVRDNQINIKLLDYSAFSGEKIQARIVHANMMLASQELDSVEELNAFLQQQITRIPKGVFVIEIKWADKIEHLKMLKAL